MIGDVHYFNEMNKLNPGGSGMSTSRKSVYSNKELQKNNFFKEEQIEQKQPFYNQFGHQYTPTQSHAKAKNEVDEQLDAIKTHAGNAKVSSFTKLNIFEKLYDYQLSSLTTLHFIRYLHSTSIGIMPTMCKVRHRCF